MSTARFVGRVGALAVALGVGFTAVTAPGTAIAAPSDSSTVDSTALLVCGGACPTFQDAQVEPIMNQFIRPTHPGRTITPVAVTTPSEAWPITGLLRLIGSVTEGDPSFFGPGGAVWPDEPWWKLSGLFDMTADQSTQAGVAALQAAMAAHGGDHLVIFGYSMGANTAIKEKRQLAAQYPPGTTAPDINFVLIGDPDLPNGGLAARFPGLNTVILGTFDGPEPTDTPFHTDVITRQYDGAADFPLYPLNVIADLNAVLGFFYVHTNYLDAVSLPADPTTSPAYQGTHGDSSYYFFPTQHLPLFDPLRQLGVPEGLIDVVEPVVKVLVDLGYDRSIPPWQPTTARLIPPLNPATVITDLVEATGEGINNAAALVGLPPLAKTTALVTHAASATKTATTGLSPQVTSSGQPTQTQQATASAISTPQVSADTATSTTVTETATATSTAAGAVNPTASQAPGGSATSGSTAKPAKRARHRASTRTAASAGTVGGKSSSAASS